MEPTYDFWPDNATNYVTCVGLGSTGVDVAEHLCRMGVRDLHLVIGDVDGPALRASHVLNRMMFTADELEQPLNDRATINAAGLHFKRCAVTVILFSINDPLGQRLLPLVVAEMNRIGQLCVFVILIPPGLGASQQAALLPELQRFNKNMIVVDSQFGSKQNPWYHAGKVVQTLTGICGLVINIADLHDLHALLKEPGRMALVSGTGEGENRITDAFDELLGMVEAQYVNIGHTTKLLLLLYSSSWDRITPAEQRTAIKKLTSSLHAEAALFKVGYIIDETAVDRASLHLFTWMPFNPVE